MICGWIEVEEPEEEPVAHHSDGSSERRNRIYDVSNHVRETFLLHVIKVSEVPPPKITAFVQEVCVQKQDANAENRDEAQELPTLVTIAHLFARTRHFQTFGQIILASELETSAIYSVLS
jgi:hypothetical protein